MRYLSIFLALTVALTGCSKSAMSGGDVVVSSASMPPMAWDHRPEADRWTKAGLTAVATHGRALLDFTPRDSAKFCPGYKTATASERAAFWVGVYSALAKYESTWNPQAVGGGGQWFGLTQISPATAKGYGCKATSGQGLLNGADNISCAIRIGAVQATRDGAVAGDGRQGLGRDWAPFRDQAKLNAIARFTATQPYCR